MLYIAASGVAAVVAGLKSATAACIGLLQPASHRAGCCHVGCCRASHDADLLSAVEDAESDLSNHQWYSNTVSDNLAVPVGFFENSNVAAWPPTKETDPTVVEAAAEEEHRICCRQLLAHVSHVGLTQYGSSTLLGSSRNRPKVLQSDDYCR